MDDLIFHPDTLSEELEASLSKTRKKTQIEVENANIVKGTGTTQSLNEACEEDHLNKLY